MQTIEIQGAKTHNLKNIHLTLPRDKLIVITGPSGSGKSSLAFDTLYAEGQRRYVESLSTYARQFLSIMEKPEVDHIEGLSPAISIEQKSTSHNPRSTVGTITEIYDYLRLLYARAGEPRCPEHQTVLSAQTINQMVDIVLELPAESKIMVLAPVIEQRKGEHIKLLADLSRQGFIRARINGEVVLIDDAPKLDLRKKHTIEVVIDRLKIKSDISLRLSESFETALNLTEGIVRVAFIDAPKKKELVFSSKFSCPECGYNLSELEPRLFSFNNPKGACSECDGLGIHSFFDPERVIHDEQLSLASGAIRGWDKRHPYYYQMLKSLAKHYDFNLKKPFATLRNKVKDILLYGSDDENITFRYTQDNGRSYQRTHPFEGVIPAMQRRYLETESDVVRQDLSRYMSVQACPECQGTRLCIASRHVYLINNNIPDITSMPIGVAFKFFEKLTLPGKRGEIANKIKKEIISRLRFLVDVGLEYLTLSRSADTLSGGEAQRIRLASQIGAGLVGVMYILDEPTIGLHQRDNNRLLRTLTTLRDMGNTVIVVEHDEDTIRSADHIVDIGPGAGIHGGQIIASGPLKTILANKQSITGRYLSKQEQIEVPTTRHHFDNQKTLTLFQASGNNLHHIDVTFPIGLMTCVTGVSGSGKSTLINNTLYPIAANNINRNETKTLDHSSYEKIEGLDHFDKVIDIDQSPIGRTPRSNPATYTGLFTVIRELFAGTQEARSRGYKPGRFSFNVKGGRCEACSGDGVTKVEMHFLPDIYVTCDICQGKRYNRETLDIRYKHCSILDVLNMTIEEARVFFDPIPTIARKLQTLIDVGLSYLTLGQNATTLSGGEAQRIKLSRELSKRDTGNTLYILDEPTTGLHFHDVKQLLTVLHRLRDQGNTVIIIEHNLDVIKTADWIIDLGPEGGDKGGRIVAEGTPEEVSKHPKSLTGQFLAPMLE